MTRLRSMNQWDAVMETTQIWPFHLPFLWVTQLRITVKVYCSLHEMHLGMKENNFLPSKHASHSFFSKSWHNKITLVARRGGCWKLHSHFCTLLHAKMILFSDYWIRQRGHSGAPENGLVGTTGQGVLQTQFVAALLMATIRFCKRKHWQRNDFVSEGVRTS